MYRAAKNIMKETDEKLSDVFSSPKVSSVVEFLKLFDFCAYMYTFHWLLWLLQYNDYKLIITGHSLGAGVGAILAVLYREEYHNLHCYAFSPPGSLFTLPLVEYSKSFITTVIYGNDIVPRFAIDDLVILISIACPHLKTSLIKHTTIV